MEGHGEPLDTWGGGGAGTWVHPHITLWASSHLSLCATHHPMAAREAEGARSTGSTCKWFHKQIREQTWRSAMTTCLARWLTPAAMGSYTPSLTLVMTSLPWKGLLPSTSS